MSKEKKGFTLIELLLVIVIIGILAGAVFVMIGNGDNARRKTVLSTAKSIMPYAQECLFKGKDLQSVGRDAQEGGGIICEDSITVWPKIGVEDCTYDALAVAGEYSITCDAAVVEDPSRVSCDSAMGTCEEVMVGP